MQINSYQFGKMVIDDKTFTNDLKIFPEKVKSNWWRNSGHDLSISDIQDVIEYQPDVLIIGTGNSGRMKVGNDIIKYLKKKGITKISVEKTNKAVKLYNQEQNEKKVGAFHLTC